MTHKSAAEVGAKLGENLKSVETTGEPVAIESDGRTVAVLVSAEAFALLERLREEEEDRRDLQTIREARNELGSIPWETIKTDLGLGPGAVPNPMEAVRGASLPQDREC